MQGYFFYIWGGLAVYEYIPYALANTGAHDNCHTLQRSDYILQSAVNISNPQDEKNNCLHIRYMDDDDMQE